MSPIEVSPMEIEVIKNNFVEALILVTVDRTDEEALNTWVRYKLPALLEPCSMTANARLALEDPTVYLGASPQYTLMKKVRTLTEAKAYVLGALDVVTK